jgi:F-type H+-transporting ATPase subunit epsilon
MLTIQIVSPKGTLYDGEVNHAVFNGVLGEFAVYADHAPLISALNAGEVRCVLPDGKEESVATGSGFAEVNNDKITVCVE